MKTQVKIIAAAVASVAAFGAQAAVLDSSTTPVVTVYITGASAQKQAYEGAGPNVVCDVPGDARWFKSALGDEAFLCEAKAGFGNVSQGDAVLVINRSAGGSAAGVNQILSDTANEAEADALTLPCGAVAGGATPTAAVNLTCTAKQESHAALSDVNANEFEDGVVIPGATYGIDDLETYKTITGLQGFGIIAGLSGTYTGGAGANDAGGKFNSVDNMYRKLQEYNVLLGLLPASCTSDAANTDVSSDCQPSISSAQYRSLVSVEGDATKSAAALLPGVTVPAGTKVVVQRRVKTSGTQASSNIFFLDNICKTTASPWNGNLTAQGTVSTAKYQVVENSETSGVRNNVAAGAANTWALGVISLDNASTHKSSTKRRWVKIDGVSPDFPVSATAQDTFQRDAVRTGRYPFAFEMVGYLNPAFDTSTAQGEVAQAVIDGIKTSDASVQPNDLKGIAYLDGFTAAKQALFTRNGNNCQPLK